MKKPRDNCSPELDLLPSVPFFRLMRAADLADVMRIVRRCFKGTDRFELKKYLELLENGAVAYVVGSPVRAVMWLVRIRKSLEIITLATTPTWRRRGYAQMLLEHAIACLRWGRYSKIVLVVRVSNKGAIKLYQRYGFRIVKRKKKYYEDEDGFEMRLKRSR